MNLMFLVVGLTLALTQTPVHCQSQTAVVVSTDSTRLLTVSSPQYDFYYSIQQADRFTQTSIASYVLEDKLKKNRFRDKTYTEMVPKGQPVGGGFDDYELIGTGTLNEIKPNAEW